MEENQQQTAKKPSETVQVQPEEAPHSFPIEKEATTDDSAKSAARPKSAKRKKRMLHSLEEAGGIVLQAVKLAGINRQTHYNWMKADPEYAKAVDGLESNQLDMAEAVVLQKMTAKDRDSLKAAIFYLENKGKRRGYGQKQGVAVQVNTSLDLREWLGQFYSKKAPNEPIETEGDGHEV